MKKAGSGEYGQTRHDFRTDEDRELLRKKKKEIENQWENRKALLKEFRVTLRANPFLHREGYLVEKTSRSSIWQHPNRTDISSRVPALFLYFIFIFLCVWHWGREKVRVDADLFCTFTLSVIGNQPSIYGTGPTIRHLPNPDERGRKTLKRIRPFP